jgi:Helix-turn-helix domain
VKTKSLLNIKPLFLPSDLRRRIPLYEVAQLIGLSTRKARRYAMDGTIPGARQFGRWKEWSFDRETLEAWWQEFNLKSNYKK